MKPLCITSLLALATSFLSSKVNGQIYNPEHPVYLNKVIGKIKVNEDSYLSINNIAGGKLNSDRKEELYDCEYTYAQGTNKIKFNCSYDVYNCRILRSCEKQRTMNVSFLLRGGVFSNLIEIDKINLFDVNGKDRVPTDILFEQRYDNYNVGHYLINGEKYDIKNSSFNETKLMEIYHHSTDSKEEEKPAIMNYNWFLMANDTYIGIGN